MMRKNFNKKVMTTLLGMMMSISLAACGGQNSANQSGADNGADETEIRQEESVTPESTEESSDQPEVSQDEVPEESESENQTVQPDEEEQEASADDTDLSAAEDGKTLVVYYSATGNTEGVAGYIAAATDADVFVLEPVEPYSSEDLNWSDENSRVVYEHDNPEARNVELVTATVEDWESYDTVFIGYPIWWHIAAWPVDGFIAANDFTGKTVIPFCTSSSSDLGESGELLAQAAGAGNWLEGERFSSSASEETVRTWVESLGLQTE